MVGKRRMRQKNFWSDIDFVDQVREIKRLKSFNDKKDYSDADITNLMVNNPLFEELKRSLTQEEGGFTAQIKIQMDRKRKGGRLL